MAVVRSIDIKENFSKISQMVYNGETVIITRPHNRNLVLITEADYNENYKKTVELKQKRRKGLTDTKARREALRSLHGLLAGEDINLNEVRAERRAEKYGRFD